MTAAGAAAGEPAAPAVQSVRHSIPRSTHDQQSGPPDSLHGGSPMKAPAELLAALKEISRRLDELSSDPARHDLDLDAIVDLNMARSAIDKLVNRVERLVN